MGPEYLRASNGDGPAIRATVSSDRLPTDMDLITDSVANWPPKGIATSGTPDDDGVIIPDTECVFYYVLSGTIIHITGFAPGYSDVGNTENQIVILKPVTAWADEIADTMQNAVTTNTSQTVTGDKEFTGTLDMSGGYALYNPITTEQQVIDMTSPVAMRSLKPGSYGVYENNGATNVPGGSGVGGILEVSKAALDGIGGYFYRFTFSRVSVTSTNDDLWKTTCSDNTAVPLKWSNSFLDAHPVGSTYWNETDSRNPGSVWGGSWVALQGVVLGGRSTAGGSPFNVTAGTIIGADKHLHPLSENGQAQIGVGTTALVWRRTDTASYVGTRSMSPTSSTSYTFTQGTGLAGNTDDGSSIQRTLVGYLWKRTA